MNVIRVESLRAERDGVTSRVTAEVGGTPVWFSTCDGELDPAPEAIASAFLVPAAARRSRLVLPAPLDSEWLENCGRLLEIVGRWWRYTRALPVAPPGGAARDALPASGTGLFFSGGVDSFHVLLRCGEAIDLLVTVAGFDFDVDDDVRAAAVEATLREVAAARGARPVFVRTNLRHHPLYASPSWPRTHGGAMAAVAHLLGRRVGRMLIAESAPGDREIPWGSHWRTDPLWSSRSVAIVHSGRGLGRIDKLRAIGADPLVRRHLRVCWKNAAPTGNCSRCNKCVLAMLILEESGLFAGHPFEGRDELAQRIDALRRTPDRIHTFAELAESPRLDPAIAAAVRRFVRRSRHEMSWPVRWRRRLAGAVLPRRRREAP